MLIDTLAQADSWALKVDTHKETGQLVRVTLQGQGSGANIRKAEDKGQVAARKPSISSNCWLINHIQIVSPDSPSLALLCEVEKLNGNQNYNGCQELFRDQQACVRPT